MVVFPVGFLHYMNTSLVRVPPEGTEWLTNYFAVKQMLDTLVSILRTDKN